MRRDSRQNIREIVAYLEGRKDSAIGPGDEPGERIQFAAIIPAKQMNQILRLLRDVLAAESL